MMTAATDRGRATATPIDWRPAPLAPSLETGEPHLWRIHADSRGMDLELALSYLGERQQARAGAMRHAAFRERYIRAQAGLRLILSRYLGDTPARLRFDYGPAGKPYLDGPGGAVRFNLTTTGDLALVGLCAGTGPEAELGVDCEWIRPRIDILAVARRMFAPEVTRALETTAEPERLHLFYRAWTALEADAKCDGRGLFRPRAPGAFPPEIRHVSPAPGYIAAVARADLPPPHLWRTYALDGID